jgi:hypothetical protein
MVKQLPWLPVYYGWDRAWFASDRFFVLTMISDEIRGGLCVNIMFTSVTASWLIG